MSGQRPKGYMDWTPTPDVARWVGLARDVTNEYAQYGPPRLMA